MGRIVDMTGEKYSRLAVIRRVSVPHSKNSMWLCRCECGTERIVRRQHLVAKETVSCGCFKRESEHPRR